MTSPKESISVEYCENTSVHGFSYWTKSGLAKVERLFWVLVTFVGFVCAAVTLIGSVNDWIETPVGKKCEKEKLKKV